MSFSRATSPPTPASFAAITRWRPYLELHAAVLLAGFTAVLGELIRLDALPLVWWRVTLATLSFVPIVVYTGGRARLRAADGPADTRLTTGLGWRLLGIGGVVGLHWVAFYASVKLANASVAVLCFSLVTLFTALLEPIMLHQRLSRTELGLGALVIPGMALVVRVVTPDYYLGIGVGIVSALLAAVFAILNKSVVGRVPAATMSMIEMGGAALLLSALLPVYLAAGWLDVSQLLPSPTDWVWLACLVLFCTTLAFALQLRSLRQLSAFASNLAYGLEPVYGVLLAVIILRQDEELSPGFYLGTALIVAAIIAHPLLLARAKHASSAH